MNKLILTDLSAAEAISYKLDLDRSGLAMGQDYQWRFQPVKYSGGEGFDAIPIAPSQVIFEFADSAMASFYRLKWA